MSILGRRAAPTGTVFYLYTPFAGAILRVVLDALQREARRRPFRICASGPCTPIIAGECWLEPGAPQHAGRVALFQSRART